MIQQKKCPHCHQSYSDIALNFCLDDGFVLSDSFDVPRADQTFEIETLVRPKNKENFDDSDQPSWQYQKTKRTQDEHPISTSPQTSERSFSEWTASDFVREVTFQVTGHHTFHAQECLELLRHFLNRFIGTQEQLFVKTSWQNGKGHFYTKFDRLTYDFQRGAEPSPTDLLLQVLCFSTGSDFDIERANKHDRSPVTLTVGRAGLKTPVGRSRQNRTSGGPLLQAITTAVARYPNLGLLIHPNSNHRITKSGHTGSVWIVPRHRGVSITANGQSAPRLYREMERLLGSHHREDTKGYRYFQANDPKDVELIIGFWSKI